MAREEDQSELILSAATDTVAALPRAEAPADAPSADAPSADAPSADAPSADAPSAAPVEVAARASSAARSALMVTAGIIVARLFGLIRQRVVAHYFGTSAFADVIAAAFRVGNITQNLLGEGTLSASFIPVYARLRAGGKIGEATHFARAALGLLLVSAFAASALGVLLAPWLTLVIAAGFDGERLASTTRLVRVVFPMTGLLVLSAWALGVLNAHRRFFLPYAAPVVWSLAQIAGLLIFGSALGFEGEPLAMALGVSALVGAGLQLLILLPSVRALIGAIGPRFDTKDESVREATGRLPSVLLGRGVIQISGLVDTLLVSFLGAGANAAFGYAQTVYLLPMSLLGTGEAAAALPEMASESAEEDRAKRDAALRERLGSSLSRVVVLTMPAMMAFLVLGEELIRVLLQGGQFDAEATARVTPLLGAYGVALLGNASGRVLTTTSYAIGDAKTPARYALVRVVASTVGALVLMRFFDVMGVVLGAVIAAWVETVALGLKLRGQIGGLGLEKVAFGRSLLLGAASVAAGVIVRAALPAEVAQSPLGSLMILAAFGASFAVFAPSLGLIDLRSLLRRRG